MNANKHLKLLVDIKPGEKVTKVVYKYKVDNYGNVHCSEILHHG